MDLAQAELKDFVSMAVCGLSDEPHCVRAEITPINETAMFILIYCAGPDKKRIMGKQGRNLDAIRTLVRGIGAKHRLMTVIQIKE